MTKKSSVFLGKIGRRHEFAAPGSTNLSDATGHLCNFTADLSRADNDDCAEKKNAHSGNL